MMQRSAFFVVPIRCHIGRNKSVFNPVQLPSFSRIVPCALVFAFCYVYCYLVMQAACFEGCCVLLCLTCEISTSTADTMYICVDTIW